MVEPDLRVGQFKTKPKLRAELTDENEQPLPINGAEVLLTMAPWKGGPVVAEGSAAVLEENATRTLVEYAWAGSGETRMPGYHHAMFSVDGEGVPSQHMLIEIVPEVGDAG